MRGVVLELGHFLDLGVLFGGHGLHGGDVDFITQGVLVEFDVGGKHAAFIYVVVVGQEVV